MVSDRAAVPTLGQGPDVSLLVVQDEVESSGRVHDAADARHAGELQQRVGDAGAAAARQPLQRRHQQVQTLQLQELDHPRLVALLQAPPQTRVVHYGGNLQATRRHSAELIRTTTAETINQLSSTNLVVD